MVYAYIRQVPYLDNLVIQKNDILAFSHYKNLKIDQEVIEYSTKDLPIDAREEFGSFLKSLDKGEYTVFVASLSVLSSRMDELVKVINCMLSHNVDLWICDIHLLINRDTRMTDIFPLLEKHRKESKENVQLGRPKGSKSQSKFDIYHSEIIAMLSKQQTVSAIARTLGVSRSSLKDYIISRELKSLVSSIGSSVVKLENKEVDNIILICPFEQESIQKRKVS
ncbi:MAG: recombinase family protein [Sulfurovum sp.]|nr:recombinase family protein [Sulfurovum sp.]